MVLLENAAARGKPRGNCAAPCNRAAPEGSRRSLLIGAAAEAASRVAEQLCGVGSATTFLQTAWPGAAAITDR